MNCMRPIFKSSLSFKSSGEPEEAWVGEIRQIPVIFLKPSPLAFDQKIATDTLGQNWKGQEGANKGWLDLIHQE